MAQQARPKVAGQSEDLRVQLTSFSTLTSRMPFGSFSSRPMTSSVPVEAAATPHVDVREADRGDEQDDLHQPEQAELVGRYGERVEEEIGRASCRERGRLAAS